jgi:hypothetical protein
METTLPAVPVVEEVVKGVSSGTSNLVRSWEPSTSDIGDDLKA